MKKYVSLLVALAMIFSTSVSINASTSREETMKMLEYLEEKIDQEMAEFTEEQKEERAKEILEEVMPIDSNEEEIVEVKNETIIFDNELYEGKTAEEITKEKLMFCGFPEDIAEGIMSEDMIEVMSGETEAVKQTIYMKEVVTDDKCELVTITEEERNSRIMVAAAEGDESTSESMGGNTSVTMDGGTLKLELLCAWDKANTSHVVIGAKFAWETMPTYRGQDFFGVSKDSYTTIEANSYLSFYKYIHQPYRLMNSAGTVSHEWLDASSCAVGPLTTEVGGNPESGMVMAVNVPSDYHPPQPIQGAAIVGYDNKNLSGACSFAVNMAQPNVTPTNYVLWLTYCHQKYSYTSSISISIPLGASITVEPQEVYERATYALNMQYNKN
ncbi:MAG: hypothetical protein IKU60_04740 [Clostridia bacterium]|nr:hypothetical protein [Clostridia bacterium]